MEKYTEGRILGDDEYLLRLEDVYAVRDGMQSIKSAYLTKYTLKGEIPKNFLKWRNWNKDTVDILIHTEKFSAGWKVFNARYGESQNWMVLKHPANFYVEIYMHDFLNILKTHTIVNGEIIGEFKWKNNYLIKNKI